MEMSVFYPENDYMIYGGMPPCLPFPNLEAFTVWDQLEGVDTVWYLCFSDGEGNKLE